MKVYVLCVVAALMSACLAQDTRTTTTAMPTKRTTTTATTTTVAPKRCCQAAKFEMKAGVSMSGGRGHGKHAYLPRVSVDFTRKAMAVREMVPGRHGVFNFTTIADFKNNMAYIAYDGGKRCKSFKIPGQIGGQCMPADAHKGEDVTFGLGAGSLKAEEWYIMRRDPRTKMGVFASFVVQKGSCAPITEMDVAGTKKRHFEASILYFDYTSGIRDPKVFTPPASCKKATDADISELSDVANAMLRSFTEFY